MFHVKQSPPNVVLLTAYAHITNMIQNICPRISGHKSKSTQAHEEIGDNMGQTVLNLCTNRLGELNPQLFWLILALKMIDKGTFFWYTVFA